MKSKPQPRVQPTFSPRPAHTPHFQYPINLFQLLSKRFYLFLDEQKKFPILQSVLNAHSTHTHTYHIYDEGEKMTR